MRESTVRAGGVPEPAACGSSSVGGKELFGEAVGAATVCGRCGRSLSQSSGKSEGVSKVGLRWAGAGGLCRSRVRLGTHETSAICFSCQVVALPGAQHCASRLQVWYPGLDGGFPGWVCGSNRVWSVALGRHLSGTDPPAPARWLPAAQPLPC